MKKTFKFLFIAVLFAAMFTSCSEDEPDPVFPAAGFTYAPAEIVIYDVVTFTNTTVEGETYVWNFGDQSATSIEMNPTHMYTVAGTYTVTLTATNDDGDNISEQIIIVDGINNYCTINGSISYVDGDGDHVDGYVYDGAEMAIDSAYWQGTTVRMTAQDSKFTTNPLLLKFKPNLGLGNLDQVYTYSSGADTVANTYDFGMTGDYAGFSFAWTVDAYGISADPGIATPYVDATVTLVYTDPTSGEEIYDIIIDDILINGGDYALDWSSFLGSTNSSTVSVHWRGPIIPEAK